MLAEKLTGKLTDVKIAHVIYTFGIGLFAGLLYTFEQGVIPALNTLTAAEYAKMEQGLIRALDAFPTGVIVVTTVSMLLPLYTLIRLWGQRHSSFWRLTLIAWILFCFFVSIFTIVLNVPLNNLVLSWDAANPPADWQSVRDSWNFYNTIRTPINLVSFLLLLWASFDLR